MSKLTLGQTCIAYSYAQLCELRRWIEQDASLPHAVYGFMESAHIKPEYWIFWFEFAEKIKADSHYPEKVFMGRAISPFAS